jgi:hypothetical protein
VTPPWRGCRARVKKCNEHSDLHQSPISFDFDLADALLSIGSAFTQEGYRLARNGVESRMMAQGINPEKLIYLLFKWGWRGPVALALVIFGIWLLSEWTK